jgi:hypothetical protein
VTFLAAALAIVASGYAALRTLRLATGSAWVDVPLSWFAGSAWLGLASFTARGLLGVPSGPATAIAVLALPFAGWALRGRVRPRSPAATWMPRPAWLFLPMAAWTLAVGAAVTLHGLNTPTHTDDAFRIRAYAPVLAVTGAWSPAAREVIVVAGPVPTYVPSLAWILGAAVDPTHVNAAVIATFLALLGLLVALGAARGLPEAGWGAAFAVTSMPFFAYHATSTYSDAWLGSFLAAGFAFLIAYGKGRDPADASRALLILLGAAMVKRSGELVALAVAAVLALQVVLTDRNWRASARRLAPWAGAYALTILVRVLSIRGDRVFSPLAPAVTVGAHASPLPPAAIFLEALFTDGNLNALWWLVAASALLLLPRIRREGMGWSLAALVLLTVQAAISAIWVSPEFTLNHGVVHRSLLPVSAAAAVWVAALLASVSGGSTRAGVAHGAAAEARPPRPGR